ncbi:hypothetical protein NDU88_001453 [Pleurodeles waltl]|uniref:Uncharacterized protein n=1 Tax=Pleurodeles waltl TaxID=8319 RepID=A0AAV7THP5_PLEWA|nr:hypothetical protein NDU88_001453 [Pleurodeles waltl]
MVLFQWCLQLSSVAVWCLISHPAGQPGAVWKKQKARALPDFLLEMLGLPSMHRKWDFRLNGWLFLGRLLPVPLLFLTMVACCLSWEVNFRAFSCRARWSCRLGRLLDATGAAARAFRQILSRYGGFPRVVVSLLLWSRFLLWTGVPLEEERRKPGLRFLCVRGVWPRWRQRRMCSAEPSLGRARNRLDPVRLCPSLPVREMCPESVGCFAESTDNRFHLGNLELTGAAENFM